MQNIFEFSPVILLIIPIIVGLVEVAKVSLKMPKKYSPLLAIVLGIGAVALTDVSWQAFIVQGIIAGLSASGLWSGSKDPVNAIKTLVAGKKSVS